MTQLLKPLISTPKRLELLYRKKTQTNPSYL